MVLAVLQMLLLACLVPASSRGDNEHLVIAPQSPILEFGTNFTATCIIINSSEVTADDLFWSLAEMTVPEEQYTKINRSALSVTISVTSEKSEWLYCRSKKVSSYVDLNYGRFIHGIILTKGYPPGKPENLSCVAEQESTSISPTMTCTWDIVGRQTTTVPTTYALKVAVIPVKVYTVETRENRTKIFLEVFPHHMMLDVWVEAYNKLGKNESEHLKKDAGWFVKTNPPSNVTVISEKSFPTSLLVNWTHPIVKEYMTLMYEIRFCPQGAQSWTYVPLVDTAKYIQCFRLQKLQPDTVYIIQVRCRNADYDHYWSGWSTNITKRTPEDRPTSKPDLWRIMIEGDDENERQVQFVSKDPVFSNGRIKRFDLKIEGLKEILNSGRGEWERIPVNGSHAESSSGRPKILKQIVLPNKSIKVSVTAINSVGKSPEASLVLPEKGCELSPVENLKVWPHGGQMWLEWKSPHSKVATEYVVEWIHGDQTDWQRENGGKRQTVIKGTLEKFVCYSVSVYPMYSGWIGKPLTKQVFLEEGVPSVGPIVFVNGKSGRNEAELIWKEIPQENRNGFITNYTIFYTSGSDIHNITVPANITSYILRSLSGNTKYDTWVVASTSRGSARGINHSFTTQKYAPGEMEGIVVAICLGFLFVVLMMMLLGLYKEDVLKENFWPWIPNPGESTIGNWSPDYPLKTETPKESCVSGITVLTVDVCDGKSVMEEDKASLSLKRDKYLSEEHSSGIGGSSCMSSPRHSVSDSDEGGEIAETTASTVQYSSVVASSGYKGQTPSSQVSFSRSESTQPLLESEENPDALMEGSKQSQPFPLQPCFTITAQQEEGSQVEVDTLLFGPLSEDSEQIAPTDHQSSAPVSTYMPQLGGYRPQ